MENANFVMNPLPYSALNTMEKRMRILEKYQQRKCDETTFVDDVSKFKLHKRCCQTHPEFSYLPSFRKNCNRIERKLTKTIYADEFKKAKKIMKHNLVCRPKTTSELNQMSKLDRLKLNQTCCHKDGDQNKSLCETLHNVNMTKKEQYQLTSLQIKEFLKPTNYIDFSVENSDYQGFIDDFEEPIPPYSIAYAQIRIDVVINNVLESHTYFLHQLYNITVYGTIDKILHDYFVNEQYIDKLKIRPNRTFYQVKLFDLNPDDRIVQFIVKGHRKQTCSYKDIIYIAIDPSRYIVKFTEPFPTQNELMDTMDPSMHPIPVLSEFKQLSDLPMYLPSNESIRPPFYPSSTTKSSTQKTTKPTFYPSSSSTKSNKPSKPTSTSKSSNSTVYPSSSSSSSTTKTRQKRSTSTNKKKTYRKKPIKKQVRFE
jgi:hypothetical protein